MRRIARNKTPTAHRAARTARVLCHTAASARLYCGSCTWTRNPRPELGMEVARKEGGKERGRGREGGLVSLTQSRGIPQQAPHCVHLGWPWRHVVVRTVATMDYFNPRDCLHPAYVSSQRARSWSQPGKRWVAYGAVQQALRIAVSRRGVGMPCCAFGSFLPAAAPPPPSIRRIVVASTSVALCEAHALRCFWRLRPYAARRCSAQIASSWRQPELV